jgi:hypothetical protein
MNRSMLVTFRPLALLLVLALTANLVAAQDYRFEVPFFNHLQAGMHEQDVFVARGDAVYRATADTPVTAALYASSEETIHNPADPSDVGPYPMGAELGVSLADWLAASGDLTVACEAGSARVDVSFDALVAAATYTLWFSYIVMPPTVPFSVIDLPLGAVDGSQNAFATDARGHAEVSITLEACPLLSQGPLATMIAISYHSDGQTHGFSPGAFGQNSHVQLMAFLPSHAELAAVASRPLMSAATGLYFP